MYCQGLGSAGKCCENRNGDCYGLRQRGKRSRQDFLSPTAFFLAAGHQVEWAAVGGQKKQPGGLREWAKQTKGARLVENRRLVRRSGVELGPGS